MGHTNSKMEYDDWNEDSEEGDSYAPLYIPEEFRHLDVSEDHLAIRDLWDRYCSSDLVMQPDFQRNYVWDPQKASRFIESLLLGLPIPPIFLSEETDGTWSVIDGHQRLETIFKYMQPLLAGPRRQANNIAPPFGMLTPLKLSSLEVLPELNGRDITALTVEARDKLWDTNLTVINIPKAAHIDMKYILFARLNQGSMSLNNQELRNCLYRGEYNKLIANLSENHTFLALWGKNATDKRMRHRELVLRFFAFLHRRERYRVPFRAFLNDEMEASRSLQKADVEHYSRQFNQAITWADRVFGKEVFRLFQLGNANNPGGQWARRRYELVYEIEMVGFALFGDNLESIWNRTNPREKEALRLIIRNKIVAVMVSSGFTDSINQGTTRASAVNARFDKWLETVSSISNDPTTAIEEGKLIQDSLSRSGICALCSYPMSADNATWFTKDKEPKLVHQFCGTQGK